jgi:hypothetical protein
MQVFLQSNYDLECLETVQVRWGEDGTELEDVLKFTVEILFWSTVNILELACYYETTAVFIQ